MTVWFGLKCLGFRGCKEPVVAVALAICLSGPACTDSICGGVGRRGSTEVARGWGGGGGRGGRAALS